MEIYWNGKPRAEWRSRDDENVRLSRFTPPVCGRLIPPEAAEQKLEAADKRRGWTVGVVIGLTLTAGLVATAAGSNPDGRVLLLALGVAGFVALNFLPETDRHRRALERQRATPLREPGAEIRLEAENVIYAGEVIPWRELEATRLDVRPVPGDTDDIEVEAIVARAGERRIAFDRFTMENGARLAEAAYEMLIRRRNLFPDGRRTTASPVKARRGFP